MVVIPNLDIHFTNRCNLFCEQCTHFSNYGIKEQITIEELEFFYKSWNKKIIPNNLSISGGEPLLHKDFEKMLVLTRKYWKDSTLVLYTNGILLNNYPNIGRLFKKYNVKVNISNHSTLNSLEYNKKFLKVREYAEKLAVDFGITLYIDSYVDTSKSLKFLEPLFSYEDKNTEKELIEKSYPPSPWYKFYKGYGKEMEPYEDNNIEESWNNCPVYQVCFQLKDNFIYKCAPLAYLSSLDKKFGLSKKWEKYLNYKPLDPNSSKEVIEEFFNKKAESYCGMCPSKRIPFYSNQDPTKIFNVKLIK